MIEPTLRAVGKRGQHLAPELIERARQVVDRSEIETHVGDADRAQAPEFAAAVLVMSGSSEALKSRLTSSMLWNGTTRRCSHEKIRLGGGHRLEAVTQELQLCERHDDSERYADTDRSIAGRSASARWPGCAERTALPVTMSGGYSRECPFAARAQFAETRGATGESTAHVAATWSTSGP